MDRINNNTSHAVSGQSQRFYLIALFILAFAFLAYLPSLKNQFTNWDDPEYVLNNPVIRNLSFENIKRIFSEPYMLNYHPLTMLSLSLDYVIGGLDPAVYHSTNLILHLANTILVLIFIYLLFQKMETAVIVSVLFGVHPIHLESVAWVSERKDVLYTFFFLLSLIFYLRYIQKNKAWFYWAAMALFLLSVLSKGMAVSLSVSLLAVDFFLGRKLTDKKVILEKIPFLILSLIFGVVAVLAQKIGPASEGIPEYNFFLRLVIACYGFVNYLLKLFFPFDLAPFYPYPQHHDLPFVFWICPFIVLGISAVLLYIARRNKNIFFGFAFFTVNIFLVLQILPVGKAIMADRYVYISSIGFFIMLAGTYHWLVEKRPGLRTIFMVILSSYTILLAGLTYRHCSVWMDSLRLWKHTVQNHPSDIAYYNLGEAYDQLGKYPESMEYYGKAIALNPGYSKAYNNRGVIKAVFKEYDAALLDFSKAISFDPDFAGAYFNRANVRSDLHQPDKAIEDYSQAISKDPAFANAYYKRANTWIDLSQPEKALADYNKALSLDSLHAMAFNKRGLTKRILKDYVGAIRDFDRAISLNPAYADAYYNRGNVWIDLSMPEKALVDFNKALSLAPIDAKILNNRGLTKKILKDYKGAMEDFDHAIEINPFYKRAYINRAQLRYELKDYEGSKQDTEKVRSLKSGSGTG